MIAPMISKTIAIQKDFRLLRMSRVTRVKATLDYARKRKRPDSGRIMRWFFRMQTSLYSICL